MEYGPGEIYDIDEAPPGEAAPSVDAFADVLQANGRWYQDPRWGRVWAPYDAGYRPYHRGYWQATKFGFTWIAEEPFGWVTSHYGRWFWNRRWLWRPDNVWAPAWVIWREADDHLGWAPMPPDASVLIPDHYWHFVPARYVLRVDLPRVYVGVNVAVILRGSRPFVRYARTPGGERFLAGPDPARLRTRWDVAVTPTPLLPRVVGRYQTDAWQDRRVRDERRRAEAIEQRRRYEEQRRWQANEQRRWRDDELRRAREAQQQRLEEQRRARDEERQRRLQIEQDRRTRDHRDPGRRQEVRPVVPSQQRRPVIPSAQPQPQPPPRVHR